MDFGTLIRILVRRWYVVLPALLITFLVAYTQVSSVKPEYTATGSILILQPPIDPTTPAPANANQANPFAQLSAPLRTTAVVISGVLSDKAVHTQIAKSGLSRDFQVTVDPDAPVTTITATSSSPKVAVDTVNGLMGRFTTELQARQTASGVPATQQLQTQTLSAPTSAEKDTSNRSRAMGAFAVLGVIVALCAALTAENIAGRGRRRSPPTAAVEPVDFPLPPVLMERAATFALYDSRMERRWPPAEAPEPENGSAERVTKDAGLDLRTISSRALGEDFGSSSGSAGWAPSEPTNGGAQPGRTRYRHLGNSKAAAGGIHDEAARSSRSVKLSAPWRGWSRPRHAARGSRTRPLVIAAIVVMAIVTILEPLIGLVLLLLVVLVPVRTAPGDATKPLAVFVFLLFLIPSRFTFGPYSTTAGMLAGLGMGLLWMFGKLMPNTRLAWGRERVLVALLVFMSVVTLSYALSHLTVLTTLETESADRNLASLLAFVGMALLVADGVRTRERLRWLIGVVVAAAAGLSVIAIIQFIFKFDLAQYLAPPGAQGLDHARFIFTREGLARVAGTTRHPIEFGIVSAAVFPLAIHCAMYAQTLARRRLAAVATALIVIGLPMALSRSGLLAFCTAVIALVPTWRPAHRFKAVMSLLLIVALLALLNPGLFSATGDLFQGDAGQGSVEARTNSANESFKLIGEHPVFGQGYGTFVSDGTFIIDNQYLLLLVEMGAVGLVAFVALLLISAGTCRQVRRRATRPSDRDLAQSLFASLLAIGVGGFGLDLTFPTIGGLLFLLIGCAAAMDRVIPRASDAWADEVGVVRLAPQPALGPSPVP